jgi:transcriptional regulator with XRE-family HTH domain
MSHGKSRRLAVPSRTEMIVSPMQSRAGRALLGLSQANLAALAYTSRRMICDYEREVAIPDLDTLRRITVALQGAGVMFVGSRGVRFSVQAMEPIRPARQSARAKRGTEEPPAVTPDGARPIEVALARIRRRTPRPRTPLH